MELDFGDGNTSTLQNASNIYGSPGQYTVTLTATNSYGSNTTPKTNYISATAGNLKTKVGIYNSGNWYIDYNADGLFSGIDRYIPYGASGWTQLVGDWNGDGTSEIGIYKDGLWYIDYGGSGVIDANTRYFSFGGAAGHRSLGTGMLIKKMRSVSTKTVTGILIMTEPGAGVRG